MIPPVTFADSASSDEVDESRTAPLRIPEDGTRIFCLGISHREAPVEIREKMALSPEKIGALLDRSRAGEGPGGPGALSEIAVLSTCNRFEVYAVSRRGDFRDLVDFVSESTGVPEPEFGPFALRREDRDAVEHLFRVSAGLDSMVLGETQVLGQVTDAYELSRRCGGSGPVISALFRAAIHAGKRAQTETAIGRNAGNVSSVAARLAAEELGDISESRIVVIGAGEAAELAVEALRHRNAKRITVVNRTRERAGELAGRWQAESLGFESISEALAQADIVISSTGAPHIVLTRELVARAMEARPGAPMILIDIAVPRDIDPAVNEVPGARCYDIDDLETKLSDSLAERRKAVPEAEALIADETASFMEYLLSLDIVPVVRALRAKAERIRLAETKKALRQLGDLSDEERARVEFLARSVLDRFLHVPTRRLKEAAGKGRGAEYAAVVRHLFDLSGDVGDEP